MILLKRSALYLIYKGHSEKWYTSYQIKPHLHEGIKIEIVIVLNRSQFRNIAEHINCIRIIIYVARGAFASIRPHVLCKQSRFFW